MVAPSTFQTTSVSSDAVLLLNLQLNTGLEPAATDWKPELDSDPKLVLSSATNGVTVYGQREKGV